MIGEIIGRFHPLLVHLPIGILMLAFVMELASKMDRYKKIRIAIPFVLQVAVLSCLLALFTGWIMPKEGAFDESLIGWHFWTSVSLTISSIVLVYLNYTKDAWAQILYFPVFVLTMILLAVTGHHGGSLTHGKGHLTKAIDNKSETKVQDVNALILYPDIIEPILQKKCAGCHNDGKKKGELVMTSPIELMKGGVEGPIIVKGSISNSSLIQRVHLPVGDEDHMPPDGKVQLSKNEIKLLEWWIENDASFDGRVGDFEQTEEMEAILKSYEQGINNLDASKLNVIAGSTLAQFSAKNITVVPESKDSPFVYVSFQRDTTLSARKIKQIKAIAENVTELDLSFTNMDDGLMSQLSRFKNLQKLKLQNTKVSSKGLKHLEKMNQLSTLNIYGTSVDDEAFKVLGELNSLRSLYLWQTNATEDGVASFSNENPLVQVNYKMDDSIFGDARLKPPSITASQDIFQDSLGISISRNFKGVDVFYTLDGSIPDSTSLGYDSTFTITETATIKAISSKLGWLVSEPSDKTYMKAGHAIASANLKNPPNTKYAANGEKSLFDHVKGSAVFSDGQWLGFEGEHMNAVFDLGSVKQVKKVVVGCLEDTGSYIFFPKSIEVLGSINGRSFSSVGKLEIPMTGEPKPAEVKSFLVNFSDTSARYVKVLVEGTLRNPAWHPAPGAKNWIFVDEVLVN